MFDLPQITIVGNAVDDPELRFTPGGQAVATVRVVSNRRRKNQAGEYEDADPTFINCTIWRGYAENVAESIQRGTQVVVVGKLKQRSYETKEGEKRTVFEVDADEIGVALRWATARVQKVGRSSGTSQQQGPDPWAAESSSSSTSTDDPPF